MNIYIGNLNFRVKESALQEALEAFGEVASVRIIKDRESGRSKGFGFAEMPDDEQAKQAIESLNDSEFEGRRMILKEALPRQ
ncbi:MAG: RNA-binding protein [Bacteroidales bacterium]